MKKSDIILLIVLLFISVAVFVVFTVTKKDGKNVVVTRDGEVIKELSLSQDCSIKLETEYGYNILVIENGEAYISEADCENHICEREGKISHSGETIVCLPHKIVVTIK